MSRTSIAATLAAWVGASAAVAALLGPLAAQLQLLAPLPAFRIFSFGVAPGALLALLLGVVGVLRTRAANGRGGRPRALLGTVLGVVLLLVPIAAVLSSDAAPRIHDVSTDVDSPPTFNADLRDDPGRANGIDYPDGGPDVPRLQAEAFPDIVPIHVSLERGPAFDRALATAEALGWVVTQESREDGRIEAYEVSGIFRFVDDVVIRVRERGPASSVVDLRSNSRVGLGDLGANAKRIRAFRDLLLEGPS